MQVHALVHHDASPGLTDVLAGRGHIVATDATASLPDAVRLGHDLADRFADAPPDVIVAAGWLPGLAAQVATRATPVPVVQRLFSPGRSADAERRRLEGPLARAAARTLAVCSGDVETLVALGVRRTDVRIVPLGVDTDRYGDRGPVWPSGGVPRFVARQQGAEGTDRLVRLLAALPPCELVLLTTPATRDEVEAVVAAVPPDRAVRLLDLAGTDPAAPAVPALLRSAALVVTLGDDEPELELALQAMAAGRPVVGHAVGAMTDLVVDGITGVLAPASSDDSLGDAVRALAGDDLRREALGLAAGDRARASFGLATVGPALDRVLDDVAGPASASTDDVIGA